MTAGSAETFLSIQMHKTAIRCNGKGTDGITLFIQSARCIKTGFIFVPCKISRMIKRHSALRNNFAVFFEGTGKNAAFGSFTPGRNIKFSHNTKITPQSSRMISVNFPQSVMTSAVTGVPVNKKFLWTICPNPPTKTAATIPAAGKKRMVKTPITAGIIQIFVFLSGAMFINGSFPSVRGSVAKSI